MIFLCSNVCQTPEEDPSRVPLMMLLEEMYKIQPRIGYHFLYFLKVRYLPLYHFESARDAYSVYEVMLIIYFLSSFVSTSGH
jgi:hypothetical protein